MILELLLLLFHNDIFIVLYFMIATILFFFLDKARQPQGPPPSANGSNMRSLTGHPTVTTIYMSSHGSKTSCPQSALNSTPPHPMTGRVGDPKSKPTSSFMSTPGACAMCSKCQHNPPNKGRKWCQSCYQSSLKHTGT